MSRYVSSSRGLVETTQSSLPTVQIIHESVREFFLNAGIHELWPDIAQTTFESMSHERLAHCCYLYFQLGLRDSKNDQDVRDLMEILPVAQEIPVPGILYQ
ncbi:hypothetical protein J3458_002360 [Metarhizium acridum]|uniref:uncharacterized protein n=1 Tax=Metarhizium acridum TaxID=92637 RepID=UPI001C6CD799|nr:hypothetical protein J3458_002360 [Metarhizium acridum]